MSMSEMLQLCISDGEFTPGIFRERNYLNLKLQLSHIYSCFEKLLLNSTKLQTIPGL